MENKITNLSASSCNFDTLSIEDRLKFNFNIGFAQSILRKRKELGWTQAMLAEKSGVNRVTIAKIEKFQHTASVEVILKLLYTLEMTIRIVDCKNQ